jgi:hypothetical protein
MESSKQSFPWSAIVLAGLILAGMFAYASWWQKTPAEQAVQQFFQAYLEDDNKGMAEYISVLWVRDEIASLDSYHILLEQQAMITTLLTETPLFLSSFSLPEGTDKVSILHKQSLTGDNVAFVILEAQYDIFKTPYVAILVKEDGVFRLWRLIPLSQDVLRDITPGLLEQLEDDLQSIV